MDSHEFVALCHYFSNGGAVVRSSEEHEFSTPMGKVLIVPGQVGVVDKVDMTDDHYMHVRVKWGHGEHAVRMTYCKPMREEFPFDLAHIQKKPAKESVAVSEFYDFGE